MEAVASVNNNTIVVVNTVGPVITEAWVDNINGRPSSSLSSNKKISLVLFYSDWCGKHCVMGLKGSD